MFFLSSYDHFQRKLIIIAKSQGFFPWLFSLSWEQRKLGDMGTTFTGLSGKTKDDFGHGEARFVTYMNVFLNPVSDPARTESVEIDDTQNAVRYGDVFFTTSSETPDEVGMSSVWLEKAENTYLNSFCFGYRPTVEIDSYFMAYMLRSDAVRKKIIYLAQGISRYNISKNGVMKIEVPLPVLPEQKRLGEYFRSLDNLITLHQHEPLFLVMLFSGGRYVFKSAWEQRKLETAFDFSVSNNTLSRAELNYEDGEVKSVHYGDVLIKYGSVLDAQIDEIPFITGKKGMDFSGQWLQEGDIIIADTAEDETTGKATEIRHLGPIPVVSGLHTIVCRPTEKMAPYYLGYYLNSDSYHSQLLPLMQGIKVLSLSRSNLIKTEIKYPKSQEEQRQIGSFFRSLDNLITLHQRKGDLSEKKARDFAWEQRKLSDYLTTSPEKNISGLYTKEDVLSVSGDVGIVNQIEFQGRSFAGASVLNYGIVETGDVVYTKSPLRSNPYGIIKANKGKPGIVSTLYAIYHPSPLADPDFIQCYFEQDARVNNYLHPLVNKGAKNDMKVSADNALKGIVRFPSVKEQQTISSFFKSLDDLITLHQREHKSNFGRKTNVKQSTRDRPFLLLLCSVDKGIQRGSGP